MPRKPRAKRALPGSFKQRSTKSGGGKVIKKSTTTTKKKKTSGGKTVQPGGVWKPTIVLKVRKKH